jgi:hypothetical protein
MSQTISMVCVNCSNNIPQYICGHCRKVTYCNDICQRAHWAIHYQEYNRIEGEKEEEEEEEEEEEKGGDEEEEEEERQEEEEARNAEKEKEDILDIGSLISRIINTKYKKENYIDKAVTAYLRRLHNIFEQQCLLRKLKFCDAKKYSELSLNETDFAKMEKIEKIDLLKKIRNSMFGEKQSNYDDLYIKLTEFILVYIVINSDINVRNSQLRDIIQKYINSDINSYIDNLFKYYENEANIFKNKQKKLQGEKLKERLKKKNKTDWEIIEEASDFMQDKVKTYSLMNKSQKITLKKIDKDIQQYDKKNHNIIRYYLSLL